MGVSSTAPAAAGGTTVKQIIRGTIASSAAGVTATIPAVVLAKAELTNLGAIQASTASVSAILALTNTTTVTGTAGTGGPTVGYQVTEWN